MAGEARWARHPPLQWYLYPLHSMYSINVYVQKTMSGRGTPPQSPSTVTSVITTYPFARFEIRAYKFAHLEVLDARQCHGQTRVSLDACLLYTSDAADE